LRKRRNKKKGGVNRNLDGLGKTQGENRCLGENENLFRGKGDRDSTQGGGQKKGKKKRRNAQAQFEGPPKVNP